LEEYVAPENIFTEYAYFSSYSDAWLKHSKTYVDMISQKLELNRNSLVVELASNDGYLLQYFMEKEIPVLGIEPAANCAEVAIKKGINTLVEFFGLENVHTLLQKGLSADLLIGNNVLAQVTDLNGFVESMKLFLKPSGIITMEFPHLMQLIDGNQFDTISDIFPIFLFNSGKDLAAHGNYFDVEELSTHGGSLEYMPYIEDQSKPVVSKVDELKRNNSGYTDLSNI
jgi:hypothetical protein